MFDHQSLSCKRVIGKKHPFSQQIKTFIVTLTLNFKSRSNERFATLNLVKTFCCDPQTYTKLLLWLKIYSLLFTQLVHCVSGKVLVRKVNLNQTMTIVTLTLSYKSFCHVFFTINLALNLFRDLYATNFGRNRYRRHNFYNPLNHTMPYLFYKPYNATKCCHDPQSSQKLLTCPSTT